MKQILLKGEGHSGRGVRYEVLTNDQRDSLWESAAKDVGPEATLLELRRREDRSAVCAFVVEVTEKAGYTKKSDLFGEGLWKKVSADHLDAELSKYFTVKDVAALITIFRKLHDVTQKEIEDIMGEAQDVTSA
jgi:hypothetical protein